MIWTLIRRVRHEVLTRSHDGLRKMIPKPQGSRYIDKAVHVN
jgi:hypothetical protein